MACVRHLLFGWLLSLALFGAATAGPYEDALAAIEKGDVAHAVGLLEPLAEHGDSRAEASLGLLYLSGKGVPADPARGLDLLRKAATAGLPSAEYALGRSYELGLNLPTDPAKAAFWYARAASRGLGADGVADAQLHLGELYVSGVGVRRDPMQAVALFKKAAAGFQLAAERGDLTAKRQLAAMYEEGEGVPRDHALANNLYLQVAAVYRRWADAGQRYSQYRLGMLYLDGEGMPKDDVLAEIWLRKASDQGYVPAQSALSYLYSSSDWANQGFGFHDYPEDRAQAYIWLALAARAEPQAYIMQRAEYSARSVDPALLPAAKATVAAWRPTTETPRPLGPSSAQSGDTIIMTPAQAVEAARVRREWQPTTEEIAADRRAAEIFDVPMGAASAKVTVFLYMSFGCPHCARFEQDVFPAFKAKYIDTGRVRLVLRESLAGDPDVARAGALLARCAGPERYFAVMDAVYHGLPEMFADGTASNVRPILLRIAKTEGMDETQFDACVSNPEQQKALIERSYFFARFDRIEGVPAFVIGGKQMAGEQTLDALDAAVVAAEVRPAS